MALLAAMVALAVSATAVAPAPARADPAASASAEDAATLRRARALLREGAALLAKDDPRGALDRFETAYALTANPKILFNYGIAYLQMGRDADALGAFDRFVAEAEDAPALQRAQARRVQGELRARLSSLELSCEHTGAALSIDGQPAGSLPLEHPIYLNPGAHTIAVTAAGQSAPFVAEVSAVPGGRLELVATFPEPTHDASPSLAPAPVLATPVAVPRAPALAASGLAQPPPTAPTRAPRRSWRPAAWVTTAAALVSSAGALAAQLAAAEKAGQSRQYAAPNPYGVCDRQLPDGGGGDCADLVAGYDRFHGAAIGGAVAAGVLAVAAVVFWLVDRRDDRRREGQP